MTKSAVKRGGVVDAPYGLLSLNQCVGADAYMPGGTVLLIVLTGGCPHPPQVGDFLDTGLVQPALRRLADFPSRVWRGGPRPYRPFFGVKFPALF